MPATSRPWYKVFSFSNETSQVAGDNHFSTLQTIFITLGAWILFGVLDNITPLWNALGLQPHLDHSEHPDPREYTTSGKHQEASYDSQQPLLTATGPRRSPRGKGGKKVQNEEFETPMTPTTLRRSSRVRDMNDRKGEVEPLSTPTTPKRSARGKDNSMNTESYDLYEPSSTPTGQKRVIKGREKKIILDEYEAFMNEPEKESAKKQSRGDFNYEGYSTPWTATQRKNVSQGKFGKVTKGKVQKKGKV